MAPTTYTHLSLAERDRLTVLRAQGLSVNEIARRLKRNKSTVSRELERNRGPVYNSYGGGSAHNRSRQRRRLASQRELLKKPRIRTYVRTKLRLGWSPEQIAGRLSDDRPGLSISHEAIYQYVYHPMIRRQENLVPYLPRAHWKRQLKGHRHTHRDPHIPERLSVRQRPAHIASRKQLGHWENDLIISRRSPVALNILVERKSRLTKITKVEGHTPRHTRCALRGLWRAIPSLRGDPSPTTTGMKTSSTAKSMRSSAPHHISVNPTTVGKREPLKILLASSVVSSQRRRTLLVSTKLKSNASNVCSTTDQENR